MPDLPSGVVTFLMTDIEGSTRPWEEAPDAMPEALADDGDVTPRGPRVAHGCA